MAAAMGIAGGALNAFNTEVSDKQAREQLGTDANIARYNAEVSRQQAEDERRASRFAQKRQIAETSVLESMLEARLGASGGAGDVGVALDIIGKQATEFDLDRATIAFEGEQEARRFESQAALDDLDAQSLEKQATELRRARYTRTAGAFFGGGGGQGIAAGSTGRSRERIQPRRRVVSGGYGRSRGEPANSSWGY